MTKAEASMKIDELREKTGVNEVPKKRRTARAEPAGSIPQATR